MSSVLDTLSLRYLSGVVSRQLDISAWSAGERSRLKIYISEWRPFRAEGCRGLQGEGE